MGSVSLLSEPVEQAAYPISNTDDIPHRYAAEKAQCAVFVTGDKELWAIQTQSGMRVLSPRNFWETISAQRKSGANANKPRSTD